MNTHFVNNVQPRRLENATSVSSATTSNRASRCSGASDRIHFIHRRTGAMPRRKAAMSRLSSFPNAGGRAETDAGVRVQSGDGGTDGVRPGRVRAREGMDHVIMRRRLMIQNSHKTATLVDDQKRMIMQQYQSFTCGLRPSQMHRGNCARMATFPC